MEVSGTIGIVVAVISVIILLLKYYKETIKDKITERLRLASLDKNSHEDVLRMQNRFDNLKIEMEGELTGLKREIDNLRSQVNMTDVKTVRDLEKIEVKLDKIMQLILEMMKK